MVAGILLSIYPTWTMVDLREWTRLQGEEDSGFAAFQDWLHSTDANGYRQDLYDWARGKQDDETCSQVLAWASRDYWITRADCYDTWLGKRKILRNVPICAPIGLLFAKVVHTELTKISRMQDLAGDMPGAVDARLLRPWATETRKIVEMSLKKDADDASKGSTPAEVYDFAGKLDYEEVRTLERLMEKAKVGT